MRRRLRRRRPRGGVADAAIDATLFRILREGRGFPSRAVPAIPVLTFWF